MTLDHPLARVNSRGPKKEQQSEQEQIKELMVRSGRIQSHPMEARHLDNTPVQDWHVQWPPPPTGMPLPRVKPVVPMSDAERGGEPDDRQTDRTRPFVSASTAGTFKAFESVDIFPILRASSFRSASTVSMKSFREYNDDDDESLPGWMKRGSSRSVGSAGSRLSRNSGSFGSHRSASIKLGHSDDEDAEDFHRVPSAGSSSSNGRPQPPSSAGSAASFGFFGGLFMPSDTASHRSLVVPQEPKSSGSTKSILKRAGSAPDGRREHEDASTAPLSIDFADGGREHEDSSTAPSAAIMVGTKQLLKHLNKEQESLLRQNLKTFSVLSGQQILCKGAEGNSMFFVISGRCRVDVGEGVVLGSGTFFGEMSVVKSWLKTLNPNGAEPRRSADVFAMSDCKLMELDGDVAYQVFKKDQTAWSLLLSMTAARDGEQHVLIPVL